MCWYYSSSPPHSSSFLLIPHHSSSFLIIPHQFLIKPPHSSSLFLFTFSIAFANVTFYKKVTKVCQNSWQHLWQSSYHKSVTPGVLQELKLLTIGHLSWKDTTRRRRGEVGVELSHWSVLQRRAMNQTRYELEERLEISSSKMKIISQSQFLAAR